MQTPGIVNADSGDRRVKYHLFTTLFLKLYNRSSYYYN